MTAAKNAPRPSAFEQRRTDSQSRRRAAERRSSETEAERGAHGDQYEDCVGAQRADQKDEGEETHEQRVESGGGGGLAWCYWERFLEGQDLEGGKGERTHEDYAWEGIAREEVKDPRDEQKKAAGEGVYSSDEALFTNIQ
ncbi:hypothetical protein B2J93_1680 [Marssonina coronariae]|uniref:Uncharacterized protein n=1 Tax=Diplocarpon coronariae TaxID=2795749 RepID=A0A218ZC27_9HELO|nr:hypothetical protein JHW43_007083 [Diplocarpon mali]OWP05631.1 hypothetical protein B2J93_1680 [Marssonina coronariae]